MKGGEWREGRGSLLGINCKWWVTELGNFCLQVCLKKGGSLPIGLPEKKDLHEIGSVFPGMPEKGICNS